MLNKTLDWVELPDLPSRRYPVIYDAIESLPAVLAEVDCVTHRCFVITDENVAGIYKPLVEKNLFDAGISSVWVIVKPGEPSKSLEVFGQVCKTILEARPERRTPVLALGGGVVGDLAGFVAASLLRGVPFIQIPTTLVAQVDSAIGGKTGINHAVGKNLLGAFYQPRAVLSDASFLATLPPAEWFSGLSEVVKHGLISDSSLRDDLIRKWKNILSKPGAESDWLVPAAARVKIKIVSEDEKEAGRRELLNFGHTFGHAIEKVSGYSTIGHGAAVAVGMKAAIHVSARLYPAEDFGECLNLVGGIPSTFSGTELAIPDLVEVMRSDKKVRNGQIRLVVLQSAGNAVVRNDVPEQWIVDAWTSILT